MGKHQLHHKAVVLRKVHYLYFVIPLVILGATFLFSYRHNNVVALQLRDQVLAADKDNGDVEGALKNLRLYTYSHMNSNLSGGGNIYPPIQLKYRYERLQQAQKDQSSVETNRNYTDAQTYCEQRIATGKAIDRVSCIQSYIDSHGTSIGGNIPDSLYKFDFSAPVWSPDLAGWSLLAFLFVAFLFIVRVITGYGLKRYLSN